MKLISLPPSTTIVSNPSLDHPRNEVWLVNTREYRPRKSSRYEFCLRLVEPDHPSLDHRCRMPFHQVELCALQLLTVSDAIHIRDIAFMITNTYDNNGVTVDCYRFRHGLP